MNDAYVLGVDGGGTKTLALLADASGAVVGRGTGGSSNYRAVGADAALDALKQAVGQALDAAHIERGQVRAACFGLAGVDRLSEHAHLSALLGDYLPGVRLKIVNDAELILAAGTPDDWGIGVISGTGSIVFGKTVDGRTARGGGWGYILGDEGSGYGIGLAGLRAVARAADRRAPPTALTEHILNYWHLTKPNDLIEKVYPMKNARVEIAGVARVVEQTAREGDVVAVQIMREHAGELALAAQVVADALEFVGAIPCALTGGVFLNGKLLEKFFREATVERGLQLEPVEKVDEPARGGLVLAKSSSVHE